ncbi:hypothetical protein NL676_039125 [Syzygium grande]|nr:hypothetical protein NL676_039125 [Syzygium grande]
MCRMKEALAQTVFILSLSIPSVNSKSFHNISFNFQSFQLNDLRIAFQGNASILNSAIQLTLRAPDGVTGKGTCGGYGDAPVIVARKAVAAAVSRVALGLGSGCGKNARDRWGEAVLVVGSAAMPVVQERGTEMAITVNLLVKTGLAT